MEVYDDRYNNRTVYIERRTNGLGTAGFVLAVLTIVLGWIPVFGWFTWALGLLFSFIGMRGAWPSPDSLFPCSA